MSIAVVYPGQGSQVLGMGADLSKKYKVARMVFEEVNEALKEDLFKIMQFGNQEDLQLTKNAQPAIMASGIAVTRVVEKETGKKIGEIASHTAGHSLGEYTSLVAAGSLTLRDAAKLLRIRGEAMQSAVPVGLGSMVAMIGVSIEDVEHFIASVGDLNGIVEVANDNAPGQVVISGHIPALNSVIKFAEESGLKRSIRLSVSAPFHSSLMEKAAETMSEALKNIKINEPKIPIICNYNATPETAPNLLHKNLINQVTRKVRWRETMEKLSNLGINQIVEMGTGKVLTGIARRCVQNIQCHGIETSEEIVKWIANEYLTV